MAKEYFLDLFRGNNNDFEPITRHVHNRVDQEDNTSLTRSLEIEEAFKELLFRRTPTKLWVQMG